MNEARLSSMSNYALGIFASPDGLAIVVGNVPEGEVPVVNNMLAFEATDFFGTPSKSAGSAKGSIPGRWDCHIIVDAEPQRALAFVRERLGGSPNQIRPH